MCWYIWQIERESQTFLMFFLLAASANANPCNIHTYVKMMTEHEKVKVFLILSDKLVMQ